ncbi:MAG: PAS domain S-box protein [Alphaproteobacteria bacterium]|nr:PAS domain S-box protein [Alphaproteobacteria bacterium]
MRSLLTRLLLLIVVALLPALALQIDAELSARRARQAAIFEDAQRHAGMLSAEQLRIAEAAREVLIAASAFGPELVQDTGFCQRHADALLERFKRYRDLAVLGRDGRVICGSAGVEPGRDLSDRAAVRRALAGDDFTIGEYVPAGTTGEPTLLFAAPFHVAGNDDRGAVVLGLRLSWLQQALDAVPLPRDAMSLIADRNGTVLAARPDPQHWVGARVPPTWWTLLTGLARGTAAASDPTGVPRVLGYEPLAKGAPGLAMVVGLDEDAAEDSIAVSNRRDVGLIVLGTVLALGIALLGGQALIRRPVARLLATADRLRRGELGARTAMRHDTSEFGRLGAALDALAAAQERRDHALRDALAGADLARVALAESETRLRLALESAEVSVWEVDFGRGRIWLDHRIGELSGGLLPSNTWIARDAPAVRAWLSTLHPDDREPRRAAILDVLHGKRDHLAFEYRFHSPTGGWRWIAERGAIVARDRTTGSALRIVGTSRDVTGQRDAAARLERLVEERTAELTESERRFRSIFDSAYQLTGLLGPDGRFLEANPATMEFFGLTAADVLGRKVWDVVDPAGVRHAASLREAVAKAAAGAFVRCEPEVEGAGGRRAVLDFSLKPVAGEEGRVALLVAEARDITERVNLQAQLAQAQKMEAVGQLTGGVAHDFNNLLQAVTGNLDLIHRLAEARGDARLARLVNNAERATARGARLTHQLLAFSRRQNLRPERVWVSRLIAETLELIKRAAGETIAVRTHAALDLWPCHVDPGQFEAALLNLAINARDAMEGGGELTVRASNARLGADEAAALDLSPGDYVRVEVIDTGCGIAPELMPRLFEPFFTTKEVGKGSGLGLAMVHGFARQSGGVVSVASEVGRGTTVSLLVPREAQSEFEPAMPAPPRALNGMRPPGLGPALDVLLVEDDAVVLEAVQAALAEAGHRVAAAQDGDGALALLAAGVAADVLVCDVALPGGMGGIAVAREARRRRPGLRVLLVSGFGEAALDDSDVDYPVLGKPFTRAELLDRISLTTAIQPAAAE